MGRPKLSNRQAMSIKDSERLKANGAVRSDGLKTEGERSEVDGDSGDSVPEINLSRGAP